MECLSQVGEVLRLPCLLCMLWAAAPAVGRSAWTQAAGCKSSRRT